MAEEIRHFDVLGQEIFVNDIVLHSDGGSSCQVAYLVKKLSLKMITLTGRGSYYPLTLVRISEQLAALSDERIIDLINRSRQSAYIIGGISDASEKVLIAAVKKNKDAISFIKDPTMQAYIRLIAGV